MKGCSITKIMSFKILYFLFIHLFLTTTYICIRQIKSWHSMELAELGSMSRISIKFAGKINLENMNS